MGKVTTATCCIEKQIEGGTFWGRSGGHARLPRLRVSDDVIEKQIEDGRFWGCSGGHCSKSWFWGVRGVTPGSPQPCAADDVIEKQIEVGLLKEQILGVLDDVIEKQIEDGLLKPELRDKLSYVLLRKHRHQTKKPIHRSLADIGKSVSSNTGESSCPTWWHPGVLGRDISGEGKERPKVGTMAPYNDITDDITVGTVLLCNDNGTG
ncbi:hypothetical protein IHE44_0010507 [Lamprotornis superbus]|uniref:Band 3 cytoplasmic domain-containing protein n=1 Tax=Lamprotornis superbus TaxID=245042 RepID=A0A835TPL0_9PASS|nr:hypothetical protein IHE44_0010507 [Lamprotornis superbus]